MGALELKEKKGTITINIGQFYFMISVIKTIFKIFLLTKSSNNSCKSMFLIEMSVLKNAARKIVLTKL